MTYYLLVADRWTTLSDGRTLAPPSSFLPPHHWWKMDLFQHVQKSRRRCVFAGGFDAWFGSRRCPLEPARVDCHHLCIYRRAKLLFCSVTCVRIAPWDNRGEAKSGCGARERCASGQVDVELFASSHLLSIICSMSHFQLAQVCDLLCSLPDSVFILWLFSNPLLTDGTLRGYSKLSSRSRFCNLRSAVVCQLGDTVTIEYIKNSTYKLDCSFDWIFRIVKNAPLGLHEVVLFITVWSKQHVVDVSLSDGVSQEMDVRRSLHSHFVRKSL